jgi:hypothetical protein
MKKMMLIRMWLAAGVGALNGWLVRALLWSGGRLLLWADAVSVRSAQWQDWIAPASLQQASAGRRSRGAGASRAAQKKNAPDRVGGVH